MKAIEKWRNEADVKAGVREVLQATIKATDSRCWYFMPGANGFGRAGIPDFVGVLVGNAFAVETKFGGNRPTTHQLREIENMRAAGARVWVVDERNFTEWRAAFEGWVALCL